MGLRALLIYKNKVLGWMYLGFVYWSTLFSNSFLFLFYALKFMVVAMIYYTCVDLYLWFHYSSSSYVVVVIYLFIYFWTSHSSFPIQYICFFSTSLAFVLSPYVLERASVRTITQGTGKWSYTILERKSHSCFM